MDEPDLRNQIHKRLTLNWLIQGAAQHAGMTFHHLIRDEIDALDGRLLGLYDRFALFNLLQYWTLDAALIVGRPRRFWRRAAVNPSHPFFAHPLLSKFGGMLAEAARKRAEERIARPTIDMDAERARIALLKALIRLQVASRARVRS